MQIGKGFVPSVVNIQNSSAGNAAPPSFKKSAITVKTPSNSSKIPQIKMFYDKNTSQVPNIQIVETNPKTTNIFRNPKKVYSMASTQVQMNLKTTLYKRPAVVGQKFERVSTLMMAHRQQYYSQPLSSFQGPVGDELKITSPYMIEDQPDLSKEDEDGLREHWNTVRDCIQEDLANLRYNSKQIQPILDSMSQNKTQISIKEVQLYMDECLCAYVESRVHQNIPNIDVDTQKYFFEDLCKYPEDFKISLKYDADTRNHLRKTVQSHLYETEIEPSRLILKLMAENEICVPSMFDAEMFMISFQTSLDYLCYRLSLQPNIRQIQINYWDQQTDKDADTKPNKEPKKQVQKNWDQPFDDQPNESYDDRDIIKQLYKQIRELKEIDSKKFDYQR